MVLKLASRDTCLPEESTAHQNLFSIEPFHGLESFWCWRNEVARETVRLPDRYLFMRRRTAAVWAIVEHTRLSLKRQGLLTIVILICCLVLVAFCFRQPDCAESHVSLYVACAFGRGTQQPRLYLHHGSSSDLRLVIIGLYS